MTHGPVDGVDALEPGPPIEVMVARELHEIAETIEGCPELMRAGNPIDAAQRLLMDLDSLDSIVSGT